MSVLSRVLREAAERFGERKCLIHNGRELTYAEVDRMTDELAAGLARRGVRSGQLVALLMPNGIEYVLAFTALARLDAVTTGLNPRYTAAERAKVIERAAPALVISQPDKVGELPGSVAVLECTLGAPADEILVGDPHPWSRHP